jgi:bifunctional non-homologous end joining protein LigD
VGNPHATMDEAPGSIEPLLELAARDDAAGLGDAPWPPHYKKMDGEAPRVAPSRARSAPRKKATTAPRARRKAGASAEGVESAGAHGDAEAAHEETVEGSGEGARGDAVAIESPTGRRRSKMPLIIVANSTDKAAALAGLERWKARHADIAPLLAVDDILVDSMRGRSSTWTRIRINLRHVAEGQRPAPETPDPDDDPTRQWRQWMAQKKGKAGPEGGS